MESKHIRHVVMVYGDEGPVLDNEDHYNLINGIAMNLAMEMNIPHRFEPNSDHNQTSKICEIDSPSLVYLEKLANELRSLSLYREVKVETQEIDIEEMRKKQGKNPGGLASLTS